MRSRNSMTTTQQKPRVLSLSAELARPQDDLRRRAARRWNAALHRLCLLRATTGETSYEAEWARIFDQSLLDHDLEQLSTLRAFAALDVLEAADEITFHVSRMEGISYDEDLAQYKARAGRSSSHPPRTRPDSVSRNASPPLTWASRVSRSPSNLGKQ